MRQRCSISTLGLAICLSFALGSSAHAQATQVKPWFLIVVDTSGSMNETVAPNSCGYTSDKMGAARCAIRQIIDSVGDADFGLMQFTQTACNDNSGTCDNTAAAGRLLVPISSTNTATLRSYVDDAASPELCYGGYTPLGGALAAARSYFQGTLDYTGTAGADPSPTQGDSAVGCRPINVILLTDGEERCSGCQASWSSCPNFASAYGGNGDCPSGGCACLACDGNGFFESAPERAWELDNSTNVPTGGSPATRAVKIRTYVIGFGISEDDPRIERIAIGGRTDNPAAGLRGFYASDETSLSAALNQIILDSQLTEVCDGDDDDCDGRTDEGYAKYCDLDARRTSNGGQANLNASFACAGMTCPVVPGVPGDAVCAAPEWSQSSTCSPRNLICTSPGERCDQSDDDCDGRTDEGAVPLIGVIDNCDLVDQDCDGMVDENCNPSNCGPEQCDNDDDDCDGRIDEGLGRRCGTDVGDCVAGNQICQAGVWGAVNPSSGNFQANFCPGTAAGIEDCNNEDDDCDGIVDRITRACSPYGNTLECLPGIETCIAGVWQASGPPANPAQCIGAKGPNPEVCDNKNNDCDTGTADGSMDERVGVDCGNDKGICSFGKTVCTGGNVVCNDPNEAVAETCDNLDNDCDGKIDENTVANPLPQVGNACFPGMSPPIAPVLECVAGHFECIGGALTCQDFKGPTTEVCDSKNNDCNVSTADGAQDPRVGLECGTSTGECSPGMNVCTAGAITCSGGQSPVFELCDGKDNDCDFKTDEDQPDTSPVDGMRDANVTCDVTGAAALGDVGACEFGERQCVQTGANTFAIQCVGGVGPVAETCDGEDNDCDGATDECTGARNSPEYTACVNAMVRGVTVGPLGAGGGKTCGTSVVPCMPGLTKCVADVNPANADTTEPGFVCVGNVAGMGEVCNNADDDCDTKVDEELDPANDPRLDVTCSDGVTIPACREPAPNDQEPCGRCKFGRTVCIGGAVACTGQLGPTGFEVCNGTDDDCDGDIDECLDPAEPNCAGEVDPNTPVGQACAAGQCQAGVNRCVDGKLTCEGSLSGAPEQCNNLDDDCDGSIDEGFNKGAPCTESGMEAVGECRPGMLACDPGDPTKTICINERKPVMESCNSLDDDCDRIVDEGLGLGDACGSAEGLCEPGKLACVNGRPVCTGEVGPRPETCDCEDNDCDGKIDENTSSEPVCQTGECVMCQCALPCAKQQEFAARCPQGKAPVEENGTCFCVGELCKKDECAATTITSEASGEVRCAPDDPKVGACECRNNECSFRCAGVTCEAGLVCDPTDGRCTRPTCLLAQFACAESERCALQDNAWSCIADECAGAVCGAEACRDGDCVPSCGKVTCQVGERCVDGVCGKNPCFGVNCAPGLVCNPADGECVEAGACVGAGCGDGQVCDVVGGDCEEDPCLRTRCPRAEKCNSESGQCEPRCFGDSVLCGDKCINPKTSREFCGASDDCAGGNAGQKCASGLVCSQGECSENCGGGLVNCNSECIDPERDVGHCGASGDCEGDNAGELCVTGTVCDSGKCRSLVPEGGSGGAGGRGGTDKPDAFTRVLVSGGGGCTCSVPGAASPIEQRSQRGPMAALLLLGLVLALGRRRRLALRGRASLSALVALLIATVFGSGCKVEPFCLDCPTGGTGGTNAEEDGGFMNAGTGGSGGRGGRGGTGGTGGTAGDGGTSNPDAGDAMIMRPDGGCVATESCNGLDDDCDDKVDEGTDPAKENIDVNADALNCGKCGNVCALPHAFNRCADAKCLIDPNQGVNGCDVGYFDLDKVNDNGCEYRCTRTSDSDTLCDLVDNDCDGDIDEDVTFKTDADNCGACGFRCIFARAAGGGVCEDGKCVLDNTKCDEGYADPDGQDANGCEYKCPEFPIKNELCNFVDDDCDYDIDEDVTTTDPMVNAKCGMPMDDPDRGACVAGHYECQTGALACVGSTGPIPEVCDGVDNNCDGNVDSDHPDIGLPCGSVTPGSECTQGILRIFGNAATCATGSVQVLECFGGQLPVDELCDGKDNDCDGKVDETDATTGMKPEEGQNCINQSGGIMLTDGPDDWNAATICKTGKTVCVAGDLVCRGEIAPEPFEKCDALDHDCDGNPLNGFNFVGGVATTGPDPDLGDACGVDTGECAFGQLRCVQATQSLQCANQTLPVAELCNGRDDDCDGQIDDADPTAPVGVGQPCIIDSSGMMQSGPNVTANSPCQVGTTVCAAGRLACPNYVGGTAELCDGVDQDCDGVLAETSFPADTRVNASCDTDNNTTGVCTTGTQVCNTTGTPQIRCTGEVFASAELCDGLDNDCDGADDDGAAEPWIGAACATLANGTVMLSPAAAVGACKRGTARCVGGRQACVGEVPPALEDCDVLVPADLTNPAHDEDCDGTVDDDFFLQTNTNRCGRCNNDCVPQNVNANMACAAGTCQIASCKPNYYDSKLVAGPDCSLNDPANCVFTGQEVCDGKDNDCDAVIDESIAGEPLFLPMASQVCLQLGACATSAVACRTHKIGNPDNTACTGYSDATCVTAPVCTVRPASETCNAPWNQETSATFDDDCDGVSDSVEFGLNAACTSTGVGACATVGNLACNTVSAASTDTRCDNGSGTTVTTGTAGTETSCDNRDNDCDGDVDEACGVAGTVGSCVSDAWVSIGSGVDIYAYEASRRDATSTTSGVSNARACSVAGRLPWGNLTFNEAQTACQAVDPQGRLCTEEEWQRACQGGSDGGGCTWSFSATCNTYADATCNGIDFTPAGDPIEPSGWTGTPDMASTCFRPYAGGNVFDLSGNVKEYVQARLDSALPVRGGAYNNTALGISCGFDFTVWPNTTTAKFPNVGFRCCRGPAAPRCVLVKADDTQVPVVAGTSGNSTDDLSADLTVDLPGNVSLTDVNVIVKGGHGDFEDVRFISLRSPNNTTATLLDTSNLCSTGNDGFDLNFDDQATPTTPSCTPLIGQGIPTQSQSGTALSGFNGQNPDGTWRITLQDNESDTGGSNSDNYNNANWQINAFYLKLCGTVN